MSLKKSICVIILAGFAAVTAAGCSVERDTEAQRQTPESQNTLEADGQEAEAVASQSIKEPELPAEYRITYEMENGDGTLSLITMVKDGEGNLYYQNGAEEQWFLIQENGYEQAELDEEGRLSAVSPGIIVKEEAVLESTEPFWECVETADKLNAPGFTYAGTVEIAERSCDLYTNTIGISELNVTYMLYIDQGTGICMGWTEDKDTGIFDSEASEGTFLCSEFQTDSVTLPNYGVE